MRGRTKPTVMAFLVLLLLMSLAQSVSARVEITYSFWDFGEDGRRINEAVIDAFNKSQDKITVKPDPIPGNAWAVILARIAGGNPPDLSWITPYSVVADVERGIITDLTPYIKRDNFDIDDFFPQFVDAYRVDGKIYAIPSDSTISVVGYNMDMFDAAGVEYPADDWTWDDLVSIGKKVTIRDGSGKAKQFGFTGFFGFFSDGGSFYPVLWSNGGDILDDINKPKVSHFTSREVIDAITYVRDLRFKHKVEALPGEQTRFAGEDHFVAGESAMAFCGGGIIKNIRKSGSKFKWNIQVLPRGSVGHKAEVGPVGYVIFKGSKNPDAAWEFIKYMLSDEGIRVAASMTGGMDTLVLSTRQSVLKEIVKRQTNTNLNINAIIRTFTFGRSYKYRLPLGVSFDEPLTEALRKIYGGQMDVAPAMKQLKPVVDAILRKGNR